MRLIPGKYSLLTLQSPMDNNPEIDFHAQLAGKTGYFFRQQSGLVTSLQNITTSKISSQGI